MWCIIPSLRPIDSIMSAIWRRIYEAVVHVLGRGAGAAADARLRLPSSDLGAAPLLGVIDGMMARWRLTMLSSMLAASICFLILPMPVACRACSTCRRASPDPPSCSGRSSRSKTPFVIFSGDGLGLLGVDVCAALDQAERRRRMPRMRPGCGGGWSFLQRVPFPPTPSSLIGLPVTARMDSAAPPRRRRRRVSARCR